MSTRSRSRNAYRSELNGGITSGTLSFPVVSASGLSHPVYLVLAPLDVAKREFIKVGNVAGNTLSSVTRGLDGSAAGAQDHATGTEIRAVPVHQWLDDIFDDIEALEADVATHEGRLDTAEGDITALEAGATGHYGGTDTADHPEATTSVRGFLSATDKTKLDALVEEVDGYTYAGNVDISTSDQAAVTVSLTIPAHWNSWKCFAIANWRQGGAGGSTDARIDIDGVTGDAMTSIANDHEMAASLVQYETGLVTTGSRDIVLHVSEQFGSSLLVALRMYARAVRTS